MAVMEHVVAEAFPLIVVNTNVRRADGIGARDDKSLPHPYCVKKAFASAALAGRPKIKVIDAWSRRRGELYHRN